MFKSFLRATLVGASLIFVIGGCQPKPPVETAHAEGDEHAEDEHSEESHKEGEDHATEAIHFEGDGAQKAGISIQTITATPLVTGIPVSGSIEASPNRVANVSSIVSGRIVQLNVVAGESVDKGDVLAIIESRGVGEAQAAFASATARLQNARSNLRIIESQARVGVYSRAPLESARARLNDSSADVNTARTALNTASATQRNVSQQVSAGSFASPAIENARREKAAADAALKSARAELSSAQSSVKSAESELARRRAVASGGGYGARAAQVAARDLAAAQAARDAAQSEVETARSNLTRATKLEAEGLVSTRDLELARTALENAQAKLASARAEIESAQAEATRQTKLSQSNATGNAEIAAAQTALTSAQSAVAARRAEIERAGRNLNLAEIALKREDVILRAGVANRRETVGARSAVSSAQTALKRAQTAQQIAQTVYNREEKIYRQNLNNQSQIQTARAQLVSAQSDADGARTALQLLRSAPGGNARVPIRAPIAGVITERNAALGEVLNDDTHLLTISDLSVVHADMFVPEREIARVQIGSPVEIRADAVPNRVYQTRIELIHKTLDPKTRTVEVHGEIDNADGQLRLGMALNATIQSGAQSQLGLRVPTEAIQEFEGEKVVFMPADEPNTFVKRPVEIGATAGGMTLIKSGLSSGDKVVVKGAFMVKAQTMKAELGHED